MMFFPNPDKAVLKPKLNRGRSRQPDKKNDVAVSCVSKSNKYVDVLDNTRNDHSSGVLSVPKSMTSPLSLLVHCVEPFQTSAQLLQLFRRMQQSCFAAKLCFVDEETSFHHHGGEHLMTDFSFLVELFL